MKAFNFISSLLILAVLVGCKKEDEQQPVGAKPAETSMAKLIETYKTSEVDLSSLKGGEYGFLFTPNAAGKITQLGCKMPETGIYTVTLWDDNSGKVVRQKSIEQTAPAKAVFATINELVVTKDKRYIVSVNLTASGKIRKTYRLETGTADLIQLPKVVGNVLVVASKFRYNVSVATYPDGVDGLTTLFLFGLPDFTFIPD